MLFKRALNKTSRRNMLDTRRFSRTSKFKAKTREMKKTNS